MFQWIPVIHIASSRCVFCGEADVVRFVSFFFFFLAEMIESHEFIQSESQLSLFQPTATFIHYGSVRGVLDLTQCYTIKLYTYASYSD